MPSDYLLQLDAALTYLQSSSIATDILRSLIPYNTTIVFNDWHEDAYNTFKGLKSNVDWLDPNSIYWDPSDFIAVYGNVAGEKPSTGPGIGEISPAIILIHEGGHVIEPFDGSGRGLKDTQYDDQAEAFAVKLENQVEDQLGEVIRNNHRGGLTSGTNPTEHTVGSQWQEQSINGQVTLVGGSYQAGFLPPAKNGIKIRFVTATGSSAEPDEYKYTIKTINWDPDASIPVSLNTYSSSGEINPGGGTTIGAMSAALMSMKAMRFLKSIRNELQAKFQGKAESQASNILMASLLVLIHQSVFAAQATDELQNPPKKLYVDTNTAPNNGMAALQNTTRVEVYFLRPYFESFRALEEPDLRKFGCKYESHKKEEIEDLKHIILESNPKENKKFPIRAGAIQGVYFYSDSGMVAKMVLGQFFMEDKYATGAFDGKQITADHSLSFRLYGWAAKLAPDPNCSDFIEYYKIKK